ncbi:DinB family protein [Candidatus Bipolaricaulota bacterium]
MGQEAVASQIRAALKMLRSAIEACPAALWDREEDHNPFWALAYHTLYFAHLYLSPSEETFEPFQREVAGHGGFGQTDLGDWAELQPEDTYTKADVLAYCDHIDGRVAGLVLSAPFDGPSGFHWLPFSRGEAHLYNLRHIQHHAGQLAERLRQEADMGTPWAFAVG